MLCHITLTGDMLNVLLIEINMCVKYYESMYVKNVITSLDEVPNPLNRGR